MGWLACFFPLFSAEESQRFGCVGCCVPLFCAWLKRLSSNFRVLLWELKFFSFIDIIVCHRLSDSFIDYFKENVLLWDILCSSNYTNEALG
ncbi:hypothetical protein DVH24_021758 [Malus domestica]|uniref:Uncharacterized protein n=1 Tax=Malus domestica TaxID=3750 RepID=A0A498IW28_MALDO|nr:hypothetical protein DVH24_021758 [Malus domestica]